MMKTVLIFFAFAVALVGAFNPNSVTLRKATALKGYVPDGMSPEQWKKMQDKEKQEKAKKNFAAFGPQTFKSRSLTSFYKELEKGKASHLMPVFNAKEKVKAGKIRQEDIPYMQRGGAWDNSDVKTAKKVQWNDDDKKYKQSGFRAGLDWSGTGSRGGPTTTNKKGQGEQKPKVQKLFGLF